MHAMQSGISILEDSGMLCIIKTSNSEDIVENGIPSKTEGESGNSGPRCLTFILPTQGPCLIGYCAFA